MNLIIHSLLILLLQVPSWNPVYEMQEKEAFRIYRDNLDNLYLVDEYSIHKYDTKGNEMFVYSDNFLGEISSVSIGEGLKVYVYYRNNAQLVVLDNTLSNLVTPVTLNFYDLGTVSLQCSSVQNRYWFYDPLQGAIIRTTNTFSQIFNSGNLDQLLGTDIEANFMIEWGNRLYLNDPENGIYVFDIFGTYQKTIPIYGLQDFQVSERGIFFMQEKRLMFYDFVSFLTEEIALPEKEVDKALISSKMLYLQKDENIKAFKRNTP